MARQEIMNQVTTTFGFVPDWINGMPDGQLEHTWGLLSWALSDTRLSSRDKALVGYGAAAAAHCRY